MADIIAYETKNLLRRLCTITFPQPLGIYLLQNPAAGITVVRPLVGDPLNIYKVHYGFVCSHASPIGISLLNGTDSNPYFLTDAPSGVFNYDFEFVNAPWQLIAGKELGLNIGAGWSATGQVAIEIGP